MADTLFIHNSMIDNSGNVNILFVYGMYFAFFPWHHRRQVKNAACEMDCDTDEKDYDAKAKKVVKHKQLEKAE